MMNWIKKGMNIDEQINEIQPDIDSGNQYIIINTYIFRFLTTKMFNYMFDNGYEHVESGIFTALFKRY